VSRAELDQWCDEGRISAECRIRQGSGSWVAADRIYSSLGQVPEPIQVTASAVPRSTVMPHLPGAGAGPAHATGPLRQNNAVLVFVLAVVGAMLCCCPIIAVIPVIVGGANLIAISNGRMSRENFGLLVSGFIIGLVASAIGLCGWLASFSR
jgi:hypothetical protein